MRILGLDHGTVRLGVALSDESNIIASPQPPIAAQPLAAALKQLAALVQEKQVSLIILGMPRNLNGTYGPAADKVKAFAEELKKSVPVPVRFWDERLTSAQANRSLIEAGTRREDRKDKVDGMAAALLLQSYLDANA
jgi:putative holliday junction resolvase